jgi:membrane-bound lytic murein transglycosylase MltF
MKYVLIALAGVLLFLPGRTRPPSTLHEQGSVALTPGSGEEAARQESRDALMKAVSQRWTGDLDGMIQRRLIRVLTVHSKTQYFVDQGTQRGLTYDAFRLFEDQLNAELKTRQLRVNVVFLTVSYDDLIPALEEGRGDVVAAGELMTEWRKEKVDFTNPTASHVSVVVVTGPGAPPIHTLEDLGGKEVYLQPSRFPQRGVDEFNARLAKAGRPPVRIRPASDVLSNEDILEMVNAGIAPITVAYGYLADFWRQVFPNLVVHHDLAVASDREIAMMVRKNNPQLLARLNAFLALYPEGSLERNILLQKYLKRGTYAKQVTSKQGVARFERVVNYMREYSAKYQLDYLLMGALGYQESGLDQNKRGGSAIGVMQVTPATGSAMKVGDIRQLGPNIHAGVKYIRSMMDQYYADDPMTPLNKTLFTLASYNAGPGRIKQMRELAVQRGLDPNKWFNNVELVTGEVVGRVPVQYVSNIYKYYLAYTMLTEQAEARRKAKGGHAVPDRAP